MAILVDECNALPRPSAEVLTSGVESLFIMAGRRRLPDGGTLVTYLNTVPTVPVLLVEDKTTT